MSKQKADYMSVLKREVAIKAKQVHKKKTLKKRPRLIPKNLVRGASREPGRYEEALRLVKLKAKEEKLKNKKRTAPKAMDIDIDGSAATRRRAEDQRRRGTQARADLINSRRAMDTSDSPADLTTPTEEAIMDEETTTTASGKKEGNTATKKKKTTVVSLGVKTKKKKKKSKAPTQKDKILKRA